MERATRIGAQFRVRFEALKARCPLIQEIRIHGCMIGVELSCDGAPIVDRCLQNRLLINCTHGNVIRLLPALNLGDADLHAGCDILDAALTAHQP